MLEPQLKSVVDNWGRAGLNGAVERLEKCCEAAMCLLLHLHDFIFERFYSSTVFHRNYGILFLLFLMVSGQDQQSSERQCSACSMHLTLFTTSQCDRSTLHFHYNKTCWPSWRHPLARLSKVTEVRTLFSIHDECASTRNHLEFLKDPLDCLGVFADRGTMSVHTGLTATRTNKPAEISAHLAGDGPLEPKQTKRQTLA